MVTQISDHPGRELELGSQAGVTVLEAAWTASILALVILSLALVIGQSIQLNQGAKAKAVAIDEAERVLEEVWGKTYDDMFDTTADPPGYSVTQDSDGFFVAEVALTDEAAQTLQNLDGSDNPIIVKFLTEEQVEEEWGQAVDLDGDDSTGDAGENPATAWGADSPWSSLPVVVEVRWQLPNPLGDAEQMTYELRSFVYPLP